MRQQHYTVAGHTFSLEMAEKSPLWRQLQNYEPFLSEPGKNRTFYLKATPETFSNAISITMLPSSNVIPVFS